MDHSKNCGHGAEIEALLRRQQELVTQLRALIIPQLHDSGSAELALQLFDDVIGCNTSVVSKLFGARGGAAVDPVDDKSLVRKNSTNTIADADGIDERLEKHAMPSSSAGRKRRRNNGKRSRSLVTNVPDYDGHQWRKYGQKNINGSQHARSYYRCTYTERNCPATKTIQQQNKDGCNYSTDANEDQAAKYIVVYYGDHTCKASDIMRTNNNINDHLPNLVDIDCPSSGNTARLTADITEWETELHVPALLEVFNNSLLNWEMIC